MRILLIINKPTHNTVYKRVINTLPVEVEVHIFTLDKYFDSDTYYYFQEKVGIEFSSKNRTDLSKAVKYFLSNFTLEILDVFKLGYKQAISM